MGSGVGDLFTEEAMGVLGYASPSASKLDTSKLANVGIGVGEERDVVEGD